MSVRVAYKTFCAEISATRYVSESTSFCFGENNTSHQHAISDKVAIELLRSSDEIATMKDYLSLTSLPTSVPKGGAPLQHKGRGRLRRRSPFADSEAQACLTGSNIVATCYNCVGTLSGVVCKRADKGFPEEMPHN